MEPGVCRTRGCASVPGWVRVKNTGRGEMEGKWVNRLGWKSFLPIRKACAVMTKEDLCWLCVTHVLMGTTGDRDIRWDSLNSVMSYLFWKRP